MVQRRRLRTDLRRARQEVGLTQDQVATAMEWSLSKLIRIETGSVGISTNDLKVLLDLYQIHDELRVNQLIELARGSRQLSWWSKYRDSASHQYLQFIEYEEAASIIRQHEPILIPGILQTKEYATRVIRELYRGEMSADRLQALVDIRMTRQQLLTRSNPIDATFLIDEAAIQRLVGDKDIAAAQISKLRAFGDKPGVTIGMVPLAAGLHRAMTDSFVLLEFADPEDTDVLFIEESHDSIFSQDEAGEITTYREIFEQLRGSSLSTKDTQDYLAEFAGMIQLAESANTEVRIQ
jgi:transcriptional regulator with XRE-family HTH domain